MAIEWKPLQVTRDAAGSRYQHVTLGIDDPRRVARLTQADYLIRLDRRLVSRHRAVRLPGAGPVLTCRPLGGEPAPGLRHWRLTMGDVELF